MDQTPFSGPLGIDYTATLASDNIIYIIGGVFKRSGLLAQSDFDVITTFDTKSLKWEKFQANGSDPTPRIGHSTIEVPGTKLLIIYGGRRYGSITDSRLNDYYYVYDITRHVFTPCGTADKTKTRFGHFATIYKSRYLLLSFGYVNKNKTADSLTVIDVNDPYVPVWLSSVSNDNETNSNNETEKKEVVPILNLDKLIPAIVVPIVVVILGVGIGIFFYIKHRTRKSKENNFVLEDQDPRRTLELQFGDSLTDCTYTQANRTSLLEERKEICKPYEEDQRSPSPLSPIKPEAKGL
ncbi:unnamed protein product [Cunninghamella echinulata]